MHTVTATELSRNLQGVADRINAIQEPLTVIKNSKPLFRVVPLESEVAQGLRELKESKGSPKTVLYHTPEDAIKALEGMA
jgi:prevent-host-death family protein